MNASPTSMPSGKPLLEKDLNVIFTRNGFDIACVLPDIDGDEKRHWCDGTMQWGLFKEKHLLFFVLDNGQGMVMMAAFNIWEMKGKKIADWLFGEGIDHVRLLLVEKNTAETVACRSLPVGQELSAQMKEYLHAQYTRYDSREAAQAQALKLEKKYDADTMLSRAAKYECRWVVPLMPMAFCRCTKSLIVFFYLPFA